MRDEHLVHGYGPFHFLLIPGMVPDGPETFLRQLPLLRGFGSATVFTYPYDRFDLDETIADLRAALDATVAAGKQPVLVGVSVGGGLCLELLRRARDAGETLPLAAILLMSPLTCTADLAPMLGRMIDGISGESSTHGNQEQAVERGRTLFRTLATRSAPPPSNGGWRSLMALLTPQGFAELGERRLRERIDRTLASISPQGAIQRVMAVRQLPGLERGRPRWPLHQAPTLILWGSKERHTLDMDGPGTGVLCRPDLASRHFPDCEVHWVYGANGDEVPHASLLKHAPAFNRHLRLFLGRHARTANDWRHLLPAFLVPRRPLIPA